MSENFLRRRGETILRLNGGDERMQPGGKASAVQSFHLKLSEMNRAWIFGGSNS